MSQTLESRFHALRLKIEGFRNKRTFESTQQIPREEQLGVTPINSWHRRILSEIDFCLQMKAYAGMEVEKEVDAALRVLEEAQKTESVLTDSVCEQAERCLMPLSEEAGTYKLILAGHAHIDMNWKWGWDETVATVLATFKTMLKLMEEYPEFHFSQSQASVYQIVEEHAPELMPEIQKRIREGRWEVTASAWVETDKNMPCTQSLQNHIVYAKQYFKEHWNVNPESLDIDFSPDTFGHSAFLPELDALGGVKYYYHMRGLMDSNKILYRWRAPSGKELLMFREPYLYSGSIVPAPAIGLPRAASLCGGLRTGLCVYGVGDHGGGPTRKDLNRILEMRKWPVFPRLQFGRLHDYFEEAEKVREKLPIVEGELNAVFAGCYTSQSRIKRGNRRAEMALLNAEKLSALVSNELKMPYPEKILEKAWQKTLFTHFHDILTGSCVQETREHAMGLYQESMALANSQSAKALEILASEIDTSSLTVGEDTESRSDGAGVGFGLQQGNIPTRECGGGMNRIFHIVNTTGVDREENVKLTIWDWPGSLDLAEVTDAEGHVLPCQCISDWNYYWAHRYFEMLVTVKVPTYGYTTVMLRQKTPVEVTDNLLDLRPRQRQHLPFEDIVLENDFLCARFRARTGELYSLVDKETRIECLQSEKTGGLRYITAQKDPQSSWVIGRWVDIKPMDKVVKISTTNGRLSSALEVEQKVANSKVVTTITLGNKDKFLKVQMKVDWKEESAGKEEQPVLAYALSLKESTGRLLCDVPGGALWRTEQEQDVACLRYGAAKLRDGRVLALVSDCKHGFRLSEKELFVTLINTSEHPDPYPERGIHDISLYIMPAMADASVLARETDVCLNPLQYITNTVHEGSLPLTKSPLSTKGDSVVFTGVLQRDGKLAIRMYEAEGKECPVTVTTGRACAHAELTDLLGKTLNIPVEVCDKTIRFTLSPYTQGELRIS